jgi:hypothetical protein
MLEPIIDAFAEEPSSVIKLQTLSTAMKLFFKRPAEMHAMLGRLLTAAANDTNNQDIHDRALLYIRLLTMNINAAQQLFANSGACSIVSGRFAENHSGDNKNRLFSEFNTLAVIYGLPSKQFIDEQYQCVSITVSGVLFLKPNFSVQLFTDVCIEYCLFFCWSEIRERPSAGI